ncbi:MAG: hypothetical protein L0Z53_20750, partial [Acidobacteriales bacterium]|nr:hypothetical protein [Terriglobales bacterium]
ALRSAQTDSWFVSLVFSSLAACTAITIDPLADFSFWPILLILLLSGDGRWLGAFFGAMSLGSRQSLRTMRLVLGAMAAGPTQLAVLAVALSSKWIEAPFALALLLGAILTELASPTHRSFANRLAKAEEETSQ